MTDTLQAVREQATDLARGLRARSWLPDAAVVAAFLLLYLVSGAGWDGPAATVFSLLQVVPLFWRRRHPLTVALVVAAGCLLQVVLSDAPAPVNLAVLVVVFSAAAYGSRRTSRAVLALAGAGAVVGALRWSAYFGLGSYLSIVTVQTVFMLCFVGVAWALGDVLRRRREVVARLQEQNRALARDQAQRSRLAAQDERASIAREMHDVVAHSLAVVVVQADGGLYAARQALGKEPGMAADRAALERAAGTLETLAETARSSLADTRRLVGVLRDSGGGAEYSPLQGITYLDELVERVRGSGVDVEAHVRGEVDDLPRDVDLAAYRVVQESLTNAMKHAGPDASVDVDLLRTPEVLLVRVTDDGHGEGSAHDGEGNGLVGMRERVEVLGGTVSAGPRRRGGWEVVATLPVERTRGPGGSRSGAGPAEPAPRHTPGGTP
ncbi:sensor histidine kinase [Serinicoccus sediminis]|uniref:sensor histidine kinase n=1 Tax=Serinicoccus sediminis TaxID=2306021 RepID=UPI00101EB552|nr:sensor histidine kinase [Serinicoccus sediminis]